MNFSETMALLESKRQTYDHDLIGLEVRKGVPGLMISGNEERRASVSTPGSGWVSLQVDDGFSLDHFEDEISDFDLDKLIEDYVKLGMSYAAYGGVKIPGRVRGFDQLLIRASDREAILQRSLGASLKILFFG